MVLTCNIRCMVGTDWVLPLHCMGMSADRALYVDGVRVV